MNSGNSGNSVLIKRLWECPFGGPPEEQVIAVIDHREGWSEEKHLTFWNDNNPYQLAQEATIVVRELHTQLSPREGELLLATKYNEWAELLRIKPVGAIKKADADAAFAHMISEICKIRDSISWDLN